MKKYCFGVDVGGTTVKIGFFNVDGTMLDKWEIVTNTDNGGEAILGDICKSLDDKFIFNFLFFLFVTSFLPKRMRQKCLILLFLLKYL